jgi:hypothetical protein
MVLCSGTARCSVAMQKALSLSRVTKKTPSAHQRSNIS